MRGLAVLAALLLATSAQAAQIRVLSPGVISNSGLSQVAAAFTAQTGIAVIIQVDGMGTIMDDAGHQAQAPDVLMLPMDLMGSMALSGGTRDGFVPLGRVEIGLFAKPGAPHPDISTPAKLADAMRGASAVFYTDPAGGSMQAAMSDRLLKRPDFAGIHGMPVKGDAEPALRRGDGDDKAMGLGLIHGDHAPANMPTDNPYLIGELPAELGMHMDMATAVCARATDPADAADAAAFIRFATSPAMRDVWKHKGTDRY